MTVKFLNAAMLFSISLLLTIAVNGIYCKDSELINESKVKEISLSERIIAGARNSWNNFLTANLNGQYQTLVYYLGEDDLNKGIGFNTTKPTTVAILGHFALILTGRSLDYFAFKNSFVS